MTCAAFGQNLMKKYGLSKKERLLKQYQFKAVYQQGKLKKNNALRIYFMPNGLTYNRIGISVSKKICANLVIRNRVKRLVREIYRLNKNMFGSALDIVFVPKILPEKINYKNMEQGVLHLVAK